MVGSHAIYGWLLQHPLERVHRQLLQNDADAHCNPFTKEQTKRVAAVSRKFDDPEFQKMIVLATVVTYGKQ